MANVKVALRVRPLSKRERTEGTRIIVEVEDKVTKIRHIKADNRYEGLLDTKDKVVAFGFDYCYWSVDPEDPNYASQEVVFQDLGTSVLSGAFKGYNVCLFAYGQTGSGKTYTMMGTPASIGLTPRICEGLFSREDDCSIQPASCRVEVSFLEIYNERVRDLLRISDHKKPYTLRVREHPETGPYVQGLSRHVVADSKQVVGLLEEGIANRITAATHIHDASSRSHAIFTIQYTQAILENNLPSEIASKINLVDLAGSERADPSYCKDRITEGANINKSLVTLGIVISALAQNSQMFSSCQSINSIASEVDSSHTDHYGASIGNHRRQAYIPYRDSVLTWLLKDSLGGNSKTVMIATISPSSSCYNETMSTLRYASNAKNIINKPRVNEDANVKLIRELREEIDRLKAMLMSFELRNSSPSWSDDRDGNLTELVLQNELKIEQLTKDWTDKWLNRKAIMEEYSVDINKKKAGVSIDSNLPHLMAMDDDILSTGVVLYHLREGTTKIGRSDSKQEQDIVLQGQWIERDHCLIDNHHGIVTLQPLQGAHCIVNGHEVTDSFRLSQGAHIILGKAHKFRFNHPAEAAFLRQRRSISETSFAVSCRSLEWLDLDGDLTSSFSCSFYPAETENEQKNAVSKESQPKLKNKEVLHNRKIQQQQQYVEELQRQILDGEIKAEQELEHDQAAINQQIREDKQWLIHEEQQLAIQQQESAVQTEVKSYTETGVQNTLESGTGPSLTEQKKRKLVQLELLRKCSLKKAERNLKQKKVKLHLDRIVKKQKLLEAKKTLDKLEDGCWISEDNGKLSQTLNQDTSEISQDCKRPRIRSGSESNALQCNRNSISNLHLPHLPKCSVVLKKDPCSELSTSALNDKCSNISPPRKSPSTEYPPKTVKFSAKDKIQDEKDGSFLTKRQLIEIQKSLNLGNKGVKHCRNTEVFLNIFTDKRMDKIDTRLRQTRSKTSKSCSPDRLKVKGESETGKQVTKAKTLGDSSQRTEKLLEKSGAQDTGRKFRTKKKYQGSHPGSSTKEIKKSACGKAKPHHLSRTAKNLKKDSKANQSEEQHEILQAASLAGSSNLNTHTIGVWDRWPSTEELSVRNSKAAPDPLRSRQEEENIEFSDTDSTYSVDSLSYACAKIFEEQLRQELFTRTEDTEVSENDDSQMSQDSLTDVDRIESQDEKRFPEDLQKPAILRKDDNEKTILMLVTTAKSGNNLTRRSFSLDSLGDADEVIGEDLAEESKLESFDEVPAEVFWRCQNSRPDSVNSQKLHSTEISSKTVTRKHKDLNLNTSSFYLNPRMQSGSSTIRDHSAKKTVRFSGQEASLEHRQHTSNKNLPIMADTWVSHDSKHGKSSPIIAMPSSQDCSEFQVAQLHPYSKLNCWSKKDDLRQSAAELSFVSCSEQPHRASHESSKKEMLFSSVAPSIPLPETQKHLETESTEAILSFPNPATTISYGHYSTFPIKHSYCEVASSKSNYQQPDKFPESGSPEHREQTPSSPKEATDNLSQISEKYQITENSVSVFPEMSTDQNLQNDYINTDFKDCLFRTIEKEDFDYDSDDSMKDSITEDKPIYTLSIGLVSVCAAQENYQGHKEGMSIVSDESFYLCNRKKDNNHNIDVEGEEYSGDKMHFLRYRSNFDLLQKMRYQQASSEEIVIDNNSENKLYVGKETIFQHSDQFAQPIQSSEAERAGMQENRDAVTESASEVPLFRDFDENQALGEEWNGSHSCLKPKYSGNSLSQEVLSAVNVMKKNSKGKNNKVKNVCETKSFSMDSCFKKSCSSVANSGSVSIGNQTHTIHKDKNVVFDALAYPGETKAQQKLFPVSKVKKEVRFFLREVLNDIDCADVKLHSDSGRNYTEKDSGRLLENNELASVITSKNQSLHVNKDSDHLKGTVITGGLCASEANKDKYNLTINSEELAKLINSVNKLESDIIEIKSSQSQSFQNYPRIESRSGTAETLVQRSPNDEENHCRNLLIKVMHDKRDETRQSIEVSKEEMCASQTTDGVHLKQLMTRNINQHEIQGNIKETECPADVEAGSKTFMPAVCFTSTVLTQNVLDFHETGKEHTQPDRIIESEGFSKTKLTESHSDENLVLLPENQVHDLMHGKSSSNGTNSGSIETANTYVVASKLDEQDNLLQVPEACLGTDEAHGERSSERCSESTTVDENKILKDSSRNDSSSDSRAVNKSGQVSEEFSQDSNADCINTSKCFSTIYPENGITEHSDVNFVENRPDIYKYGSVHSILEEKETVYSADPISLAKTEVLTPRTNTQNTYSFKTEKEENLEENSKSPERNVSQNKVEDLIENRDCYCFSKNETLSEESKSLPQKTNADIDESISVNQESQPGNQNQVYGVAPMAVEDFHYDQASTPVLSGINSSQESMKSDRTLAMPLSSHTSDGVVLQYYEIHVESGFPSGTLCALNKRERSEALSDTAVQNNYVTFPLDLPQQDGNVKGDIFKKTSSYTGSAKFAGEDNIHSEPHISEIHSSSALALADDTQDKWFSSGRAKCDMDCYHGEYSKCEDEKSKKSSLNISPKESGSSGSCTVKQIETSLSSIFSGNVEEITQSLPEFSSKCVGTETELKTKSEVLTRELGCQTFSELSVGHTDDSVTTSEDELNLSGHSEQATWKNAYYSENSCEQHNMNSCVLEHSASPLKSSATMPNDLLENPLDLYKTESFYLGERIAFDLPGSVNQQGNKSSNYASSTKNVHGAVKVYNKEKPDQESNQDKNISLLSESSVGKTEKSLQVKSVPIQRSLDQINSDDIMPPSSYLTEDFSVGMLFKATSTPELPRSLEDSIYRQCVESQQGAFLTPHLSPVFQVQESQPFRHQPFLTSPCTPSETTLSHNMSKSTVETDAATSRCLARASSLVQESSYDVISDRQPFSSDATSAFLKKEKKYLPVSESASSNQRNSVVGGNEFQTIKSKNVHHDDCQESKDINSLPSKMENIGKNLYHTLSSRIDLKEDRHLQYLTRRIDSPTINAENYTAACKEEMKSERNVLTAEQQNLSIINDMSSKYLSENSCFSLHKPEPEIFKTETTVLTSQNKDEQRRPSLQSHSLSAPAIIVMSDFECPSETSSKSDTSAHSASKSLQDLNMSVEPPSPTEDDLNGTESFSKLKTDNALPAKHKLRFQKKSIKSQRLSNYDKRSRREHSQGSRSLDASPTHHPVGVTFTRANLMDRETEKQSNIASSVYGCNMDTSEELRCQADGPLQDNKDAMHFISSDINPYIHPWQQDERCKIGWKQYVFGSASDVSSNPPPLNLDSQTVMRCSSVDNGLNSPFHSHLSSYANARTLSSTISSTEHIQGWDVAREGCESAHADESGKHFTSVTCDVLENAPENHISKSENSSQKSENSSMRVDEIVLLYPSDSDVSSNQQVIHTCEQATQTDAPARNKRQKRHRRSFTDIPARSPEASWSSLQQPSSWSSVQNLSVHLSQLLYNTSELLGNLSLQTIGITKITNPDNKPNDQKAVNEKSTRVTMSSSYTQTTEDIGIQTDILGYHVVKNKENQSRTEKGSEQTKTQEVNIIVKVLRSDTVALTKEKMSESEGQILQSMPDVNYDDTPKDSAVSPSTLSKDTSPSLEGHEVPLVLDSPEVSPVLSSPLGSNHDDESSCTIVSSPPPSISLPPESHCKEKKLVSKTGNPETRELYCKTNLLVDRASSPILTLSASSPSTLNKSASSLKGYVRHQKDKAHSARDSKQKGLGLCTGFSSQESHIDTSSQTEMDSESSTSRESKELYKTTEEALDENTTKEPSEKGGSEQKHRFTIDTHTAIHTKRLYHSSSTLELSSHGEYLVDDHREIVPLEHSFQQIHATERARNLSGEMKYESPICNSEYSPTKKPSETSLCECHSSSSLKSDECPDYFSPECYQTWGNQNCFSFQMPEMSDVQDDDDDDDAGLDNESDCNTEILLNENTSLENTHRVRSYSLRDLPLHNKFSNWCGVKDASSLSQSAGNIHNPGERRSGTRTSEKSDRSLFRKGRDQEIERLRRERAQVLSGIHLDMNHHPLTVELTEAKLNYGIGETDAQLRILKNGTGENLTTMHIKQQLYQRHRKSIELLRKQREERLQCFRRSRSLSPQKHLSFLQSVDTNQKDLDLPSRRREYLQQLRRDVVKNTRVQEPKMRIQQPSEIEMLLRDYQRAREETKTEIARARDKLRKRAEQEKRRIQDQILSQLLREEAKLKTLVSTSTLCTESTLSLSSGPTSGYNSSHTTTPATSLFGKQEGQTSPEIAENSRGARSRSTIRNHQLYIRGQQQKASSETFHMTSSIERSHNQSSLPCSSKYSYRVIVSPSTFPASPMKEYEDLSKQVLANATAEVMALCSNDLKNLYSGRATAGWKYQCMEKDILIYYKRFSSSTTKHGFLGAGIIRRPLPTVLSVLKDPSKRHLYDKTITTAQVYKKINSSIALVYVVSDVSSCFQKQPRDFCCISVEAKKENVSILATQSVYEESMPRPSKEMIRGEILPSAWILEPDTVNGREITKVINMVQVDLGAPAIPSRLLSSSAKRQPLVIARLAYFLAD